MVCRKVLGLLLAAQTLGHTWGQSVPTSPCPTVFQYRVNYSGNRYGLITVPAPQPGYTFRITVELGIDAVLSAQNIGSLKLVESENEIWRRINTGDTRPIQYHVYFPLTWPLPVVISISLNQNVICVDHTPNTILSKLSLNHALYPIGGNRFQQQNHNTNHPFNGVNSFQYAEQTTKIEPFYRVTPPIQEDPPAAVHEEYSSATPCPDVFQYQQSRSGEWYGIISVPNPYPIVAIDIKVEIYIAGTVPLITNGFLQTANTLNEEWNRIRTGQKYYIRYKLNFPQFEINSLSTPRLPTIKSVTVNNEVVCRGNKPNFPVLRTLAYQHSIYDDRCTSSSLDCPYNIEQHIYSSTSKPPVYKPTYPVYRPTYPVYRPTPPPPVYRPTPPPPVYKPESTEQPLSPSTYKPEPKKQEIDAGKHIQCGTLVVRSNPLITYGEDTAYGQWPWHAALYVNEEHYFKYRCGGSFVGIRTVITAAHCVTIKGKPRNSSDLKIYLGKYDLRDENEEGSQNTNVTLIAVHPSYNSTSTTGDIAVLILSSIVEVTVNVRPVCLWDQGDIDPANIFDKVGLVVGWGIDENDSRSETLRMVRMPVVSQQMCFWSDPHYYSLFTSNTSFCAGYRNGSSVCNGDSGGGMVFPKQQSNGTQFWMLRGIVSHSKPRDGIFKMCDSKNYIVFTDVAQYLDWISDIII